MPMRFMVGGELPKNVGSINLSYAFDITDRVDISAAQAGLQINCRRLAVNNSSLVEESHG